MDRDLLDGGRAVCLHLDMTESNSSSPWLTLWYKPGRTLQGLIATGKGRTEAIVFSVFFGLVNVWPAYSASDEAPAAMLFAAGLVALAGLFFFSWLLRNFGRWFGASASLAAVRLALGWGLLPWAVCLGLLFVGIDAGGADPQQMFPFFFAVLVYGFVILLLALSAALRLPPMKTFFCLIFTFFVSIFPLTFIMQLIMGASAANG